MEKGPKPLELNLSEEERQGLEALVSRHSTPQQQAKRARIVLAAAAGKRNAQIARELSVRVDTVRTWRGRGSSLQSLPLTELSISERLQDIPRPGKPSHITQEQLCQVVVLACEQPKDRPISHWTGPEIADEIMRGGIIPQISPRHAARLGNMGLCNRTLSASG